MADRWTYLATILAIVIIVCDKDANKYLEYLKTSCCYVVFLIFVHDIMTIGIERKPIALEDVGLSLFVLLAFFPFSIWFGEKMTQG